MQHILGISEHEMRVASAKVIKPAYELEMSDQNQFTSTTDISPQGGDGVLNVDYD